MVSLAYWAFATFMETDLGQPFSGGATKGLELRFVESYLRVTDYISHYRSQICRMGHRSVSTIVQDKRFKAFEIIVLAAWPMKEIKLNMPELEADVHDPGRRI